MEEKENEVAHIGKALKGKAGKGKAKRLHLEETMPTPQGRRIVPRVTTAMKVDAGKKIIKKRGKVSISVSSANVKANLNI